MSISSHDLLSLARELANHDNEVYWRDAASRAYYSAFHRCQQISQTLPEPLYDSEVKGIHDYFIKKFRYAGGPHKNQLKAIAFMLKEARDIRVKADYNIQVSFLRQETTENLNYAERISQIVGLVQTKKEGSKAQGSNNQG